MLNRANVKTSYLILRKDNKILIQRRFQTGYHDGEYGLPSGHVEKGESFKEAIIRESYEEIGITLYASQLKFVHYQNRISDKDGNLMQEKYFMATSWQGEVVNKEPNKCDSLIWSPIASLPNNFLPFVRHALDEYEKGKTSSDFKIY